jgi:YVTN family beta-propeller protein
VKRPDVSVRSPRLSFKSIWRILAACGIPLAIALPSLLRAQDATATIAVQDYPLSVAVNPVTNTVYIANSASGTVTVINGAKNTTATVAVGSSPVAVAVNPVTNLIYVANEGSNTVTVIEGSTNATTTVAAGSNPQAIAVNPVTNMIYEVNETGNTMTVINGATNATATVAVGTTPYAVAVNPVTNKIYVANQWDGTVTVIDGSTNTTATVAVGASPQAVAVNPVTDSIYVANTGDGTATVINGATGTATATITVGVYPIAVAVNPVTNTIYVPNEADDTVSVINGATNSVIATVPVDIFPSGVAVDPLSNKVYVPNIFSLIYPNGSVTVIDGATFATKTVSAGGGTKRIAVNPATHKAYAVNSDDGTVTVVDGSTNGFATIASGSNPDAVAVNPATNTAYVANFSGGTVTVINGSTDATATVSVGGSPDAVAVNPVTDMIYVANYADGTVSVINGGTNATATLTVGTNPKAVAVNPVTNTIYVANEGSSSATVINGATNKTSKVTVGTAPVAVAVNPATDTVYVANSGSATVTVINGATNATTSVAVGMSPDALAVDPVTNKVFVANAGSATLTVIDGATNAVTSEAVGANPVALALNPVTGTVYVANYNDSTVSVINGTTVSATIPTNWGPPIAVAVNPVSNKVYVVNYISNALTVIDGITNTRSYVDTSASNPTAVAVNPVTGRIYVANNGSNTATVVTEQQVQAVPLSTAITPLTGNGTSSATPSFTFTATSTFSPTAPAPLNVFFQADTWQGPWTQATEGGSSFAGTLAALEPGYHILYAYADDGQDATSTQLDSPLIGGIAAYGFLVVPPATHFSVSAPTTATAGTPISVTVTALDAFGNPVALYPGTVHFTSSDGSAVLPKDSTLTNGSGTFSVTLNTAGSSTLTATDTVTAVSGTTPGIAVAVGAVAQYSVSAPATATAGTPVSVTVTALDASGNAVTRYTGVVHFTSTDGVAGLPANSKLTQGVGTFPVTFNSAGSQTVTATDTVVSSITGTSHSVAVSPAIPSAPVVNGSGPITLVAPASGSGLTYQWMLNGISIAGAQSASEVVYPTAASEGTYSVAVTSGQTVSTTFFGTLTVTSNAWLTNLSARAYAQSGSNQIIAGFVTAGTAKKSLLIRGAGPALFLDFQLTNILTDPNLTLLSGSTPLATASSWAPSLQSTFSQVGAFAFQTGSHDAALMETVAPGAYTAEVTSQTSNSGLALAEIYDADSSAPTNRLINLSARAYVGTGANVLIGGFVIDGTTPQTVIIRADGPALQSFGLLGALFTPVLTLSNSTGTIATNSGWSEAPVPGPASTGGIVIQTLTSALSAKVGAFALPAGSSDDAIVATLPPGAYTAQVSGTNGSTGLALVEIFELR